MKRFLFLLSALAMSVSLMATSEAVLASGPGGGGTGGGGTGGGGAIGVSLAIGRETAPAGALAQMKVLVTEPKPISTGTGSFSLLAFDSLAGIAVSSHSDAVGVAVVRGSSLTLSVISPAATFGNTLDYPILTVVGHVPAGASAGSKFPLLVDPTGLQFIDPTGAAYPVSVKQGELLVGPNVVIGDVSPGSAIVPPGGVVTLTGVNFVPGTTVKFAEAAIAQVRYVSPTRLDVVVSTVANMHGMMIKITNPNGSTSTYFSYQRTQSMAPSADPVMQLVMPLLPPNEVTSATISIPAPAAGTTYGVALQNIETSDAVATVDLLDGAGNTVATTQVTVTASHFTVRELSELFGTAPSSFATVRVTSPLPIEVLGVAANQVAGTSSPILAH